MIVKCAYCNKEVEKFLSHVNRALKSGNNIYCDRKCSGLGRRLNLSIKQKKEIKRIYDIEYRKNNAEIIKIKQREYNSSPSGRAMQKRHRLKTNDYRKEYISTPKYREWKKNYDKIFRAKQQYGEFFEAELILRDIENEIDNREVKQQLNLHNKSIKRKREYERTNSSKLEGCTLGNLK